MIRFACRCRNILQTPDDQAGLTIQCPQCGLLLDIPRLSDKDSIERDGTYRMGDPLTRRPEDSVENLVQVYYPGRQFADGTEIDLRGPVQPMPPAVPGMPSEDSAARPKYDPETGELMRPIDVDRASAPPPAHDLPEARRVIEYNVSPHVLRGSPHGIGIFAELFQPINVIVMAIIVAAHVMLVISNIVTAALLITIPAPIAIFIFLAGHYATVVEETGPEDRDELPRPLRNVHPYDDLIAPFFRTMLALLLCYWPMSAVLLMNGIAAFRAGPLPFPAAGRWLLILFAVGSVFLPAVFLTICTSGTLLNLRPDRVLRLIWSAGWRYALLVLLWMIAAGIYLYGVLGTTIGMIGLFARGPTPLPLRSYIIYPALMLGVYLAHAFCWLLGLHYRRFWSTFPWIAQYHTPKRVSISRPRLHPKVAASDDKTAARASQRAKRAIR